MDSYNTNDSKLDPSYLLKTGARYLEIVNRYPAENAVFQKFKARAMIDLVEGARRRRESGDVSPNENIRIPDIKRESLSIYSLDSKTFAKTEQQK